MAKVRKQTKHGNTRYCCDYNDPLTGRRVQKFFGTREDADEHLADMIREHRRGLAPSGDADITFESFALEWLHGLQVKPRSKATYAQQVRLYLIPAFGELRIRDLRRRRVKQFLQTELTRHKKSSVKLMYATLRAILNAAVDDELRDSNPALGLGKALHLSPGKSDRAQGKVKAFSRPQRDRFIAVARTMSPLWARVWTVQMLTGLRTGEVLAFLDTDVDGDVGTVHIVRGLTDDGLTVQEWTKSGDEREVDLSTQALATIREQQLWKKRTKLAAGWTELPETTFVDGQGSHLRPLEGRRAFRRVLVALHAQDREAGVAASGRFPLHFHPHCCRHTFATLALEANKPVEYISKMLGHASIAMTVDIYAASRKGHRPGALNDLDIDMPATGNGR